MQAFRESLRRSALCIGLLIHGTAVLAQTVIHVPADQPSIQAGIEAATNGDTVLVAPGTYYENIDFLGKAITVTSSGGAAETIIDGGGKSATVLFRTEEVRSSVLSGFTVRDGGPELNQGDWGSGVDIYLAGPTILNNIITQNFCNGVDVVGSAPLLQGNVISDTLETPAGACNLPGSGIGVYQGSAAKVANTVIQGNTIQGNLFATQVGGGISLENASQVIILDNIIQGNASSLGGGGVGASNGLMEMVLVNNLITGNTAVQYGAGLSLVSGMVSYTTNPITALIANNTITGNRLTGSGMTATGGEIDIDEANFPWYFVNNIVTSSDPHPAMNCVGLYPAYTVVIDHNDIYNAAGPSSSGDCLDQLGAYGNLSMNPKFTNPGSGDYTLQSGSPLIDAGNNSILPTLQDYFSQLALTTDLASNPRVQDATGKGYAVIDMGAYESAGAQDPAGTSIFFTYGLQSYAGTSVSLRAQLVSPLGLPTGSVSFSEDGTDLPAVPIAQSGGQAAATVTSTPLAPGLHTFLATYPGDGTFTQAASIPLQVYTSLYFPVVQITSSANPSTLNQPVTFTITVQSLTGPLSSPVTLSDNGTPLATLPLSSSGTATYTTSALSLGTHAITANYPGDANDYAGVAQLQQVVVSAMADTETLTSSANPSTIGQQVTFTATIGTAQAAGAATGSVAFLDGSSLLATVPLGAASAGSGGYTAAASFSTGTLGAGTHQITANFIPSGAYAASTQSLTQDVGLAPSTITASVAPNPSMYGQPMLVSAHVMAASGSGVAPTGTVTFTFCRGAVEMGTLDATGALVIVNPVPSALPEPVGSCSVTAAYSGDSRHSPSSSVTVPYSIVPSPSTISLAAQPSPAYTGAALTFTASIQGRPSPTANPVTGAPISPGSLQITGTVQFLDGSTLLGSEAVSGATAMSTVSTLASGPHTITAVYSGDANLGGSTTTLTLNVLPSSFTLMLTPPVVAIHAGQQASVAVQISSVGAYAGTLTLSYASLPSLTTASFTPATLPLAAGGASNATLLLVTQEYSARMDPPRNPWRTPVWFAVACCTLPFCRKRRRWTSTLLMAGALSLLGSASGCTNLRSQLTTLAPGTYSIPVTATDPNTHISQTQQLTFNVLP